jgi:hypothetical protein
VTEAPAGARFLAARAWATFALVALAASLINPYGVDALFLPFRLMSVENLSRISEWRPQDFSHVGTMELALLTLLGFALTRPFAMPPIRVALIIAVIAIALQHSRHQVLLGILAPMLLARPIAAAIRAGRPGEEWRRIGRIALPATVAATLAVSAVRLLTPIEPIDGAAAPISALSAVPLDLRRKPVLNDYAFGGYLIFEHVRPFIDARVELYGDKMMSLYDKLRSGDHEAVESALKRYDIAWTIFAPTNGSSGSLIKNPAGGASMLTPRRSSTCGRRRPRLRGWEETEGRWTQARMFARVASFSMSGEGAAGNELALQVDARAIVDRRHAERLRSAHIGERVVDEQEFVRPSPGALEQDFVDARGRLDEADMAGDDAVVEFAQEIVLALRKREGFVSKIAERIDRLAGCAQSAQQRNVLLDRFAKRLDPAFVEHVDLLGEFRKAFNPHGDRGAEVLGDIGI